MASPADTSPPGELTYIITSLSGSSDSRNSSCAMTTLASARSISAPRNTMRSLSRRENTSQPRSPRCVCSTTVGTSDAWIFFEYLMAAPSPPGVRRRQPGDQRRAREPPRGAQLARRQLARLGHLDHDGLIHLQELRGLRGVQHLGRIVGLERVRAAGGAGV